MKVKVKTLLAAIEYIISANHFDAFHDIKSDTNLYACVVYYYCFTLFSTFLFFIFKVTFFRLSNHIVKNIRLFLSLVFAFIYVCFMNLPKSASTFAINTIQTIYLLIDRWVDFCWLIPMHSQAQ